MKFLLIATLALSGCCHDKIIVKTEYVVRQAPGEMYQLSAPVTSCDTSTQRGIAEFIVLSESRMNECENKLKAVKEYIDAPVVEGK